MDLLINWQLTVEEGNLVLAGLGELPAKHTAFLLHRLKISADRQVDAHEARQKELAKPKPPAAPAPVAAAAKLVVEDAPAG